MREQVQVLEPRYGLVAGLANLFKGNDNDTTCSKVLQLPLDYKFLNIFLTVRNRENDPYGVLRLLNKYSKNIFTSLEAQWQCNEDILHLKAMIRDFVPLDVELKFAQDNGLKMLVKSLSVVNIPLKSITDFANYTSDTFDLVALLSGETKGEQERSRFIKMFNAVMTPIYDAVAATGSAVTSGVAAAGSMYQKIRGVLDVPVRAQLQQMVEEASDEGFSPSGI